MKLYISNIHLLSKPLLQCLSQKNPNNSEHNWKQKHWHKPSKLSQKQSWFINIKSCKKQISIHFHWFDVCLLWIQSLNIIINYSFEVVNMWKGATDQISSWKSKKRKKKKRQLGYCDFKCEFVLMLLHLELNQSGSLLASLSITGQIFLW